MRATLLLPLLAAGCASTVCGDGTEPKFNSATGNTECVAPSAKMGVQCDPGGTTVLKNGVCVSKVMCGAGTKLDPATGNCVSNGMMQSPCNPMQASGRICVYGVVRYLRDDSSTKGRKLEVRAYSPLQFLMDPKGTAPVAPPVTTDDSGNYVMNDVPIPGGGLIAIAVTDPMGPIDFPLSGSGAQSLQAGGNYPVDLFAVEKTTVAAWDAQAGLAGNDTFEMTGAYVARFYDKNEKPVAGVAITKNDVAATPQFFFKGSLATIDKALTSTDPSIGAAVHKVTPGDLGTYSGSGGGISWEAILGASTTGVVFVQKFHPKS